MTSVKKWNFILILIATWLCMLQAPAAFAEDLQSDAALPVNILEIPGQGPVVLESKPSDPQQLAAFEALTSEKQARFYQRRRLILNLVMKGMAFPRLTGGISWSKEVVQTLKAGFKKSSDSDSNPAGLDLVPDQSLSFKEKGIAFRQATLAVLTQVLWKDSAYLAQAQSIGFNVGLGSLLNWSRKGRGLFWGRTLSFEMGVDFGKQGGYLRFLYDRPILLQSLIGMDLNATGRIGINLLGDDEATQDEIPLIKQQRFPLGIALEQGPGYRFLGWQPSFHAAELAGGVLVAHGFPEIGGVLGLGGTAASMGSIYSTRIDRKVFSIELSPAALKGLAGRGKAARCARRLNPTNTAK